MMYDLCRYICICTPARAHAQLQCHNINNVVGHAGRVQTAPKVRVCAAVVRETYLHACPRVQKFTPRNTPTTRSTKTTIMTVRGNPIMQAAPPQRRIISTSEASNQLLFHSQKFSLSESDGGLAFFLKSCSQSKKLQPGRKPNSFTFRNPGQSRRSK